MMKNALLTARSRPDPLQVHRKSVVYASAIAGIICLLPLSINDLLNERLAPGLAILIVPLALATNAVAVFRKKGPPIPFVLILIPVAAVIVLSLPTRPVYGALWCYPATLFPFLVLSRRVANLYSATLVILTIVALYIYADIAMTVRFAASSAVALFISNIVWAAINDLKRKVLDQAITDTLTGAYNRRYMQECLVDAIERSRRTALPATILMIDVDHFKRINEQFGHKAGDELLAKIAEVIRTRLRRLDLLFRIGGEEFLLLLPDTKAADAFHVAEQLCATVAEATLSVRASISIGVSEHRPGESPDDWIKRADEVLYSAKEGGRNRAVSTETPILLESPRSKTLVLRSEHQ